MNVRDLITLFSMLAVTCCGPSACAPNSIENVSCGEEYIRATLQHVHIADLGGCGWLQACTASDLSQVRKQTSDLRKWASTLPEGCAKAAYYEWAWYYDRKASEGEEEMASHSHTKDYEAYQERERQLAAKTAQVSHSVPAPDYTP